MSYTPKKRSLFYCAETMAKGDNFSLVANTAGSRMRDIKGGRAICSFCQRAVSRIADWLPNYHICEDCFAVASKIARRIELMKHYFCMENEP